MNKIRFKTDYGFCVGQSKLYNNRGSIAGTFVKPLERNGVKTNDVCDIYYRELPDNSYAVTFIKKINPLKKEVENKAIEEVLV